MRKTTEQVVIEREDWLKRGLARTLEQEHTRILLALCGVPMPMNQAALMVALANEGLGRDSFNRLEWLARNQVYTPPPKPAPRPRLVPPRSMAWIVVLSALVALSVWMAG